MVKSVFLLLDSARILSVTEMSGDSGNSAVLDGEVNSQCSVHLVSLVTKMCNILKQKQPGGCKKGRCQAK